jgi:uncharacterized protein (DUF1501 family)
MKNENTDRRLSALHASPFSRRALLGGSASLAAASALARPARAAAGAGTKPVIVQVFLRGAMDGLTTVVPYGDGDLYNLRPTLAVRPPGSTDGALDLDGFFGLAPTAAPLLRAYNDGRLAIVHAMGSTDSTRSHFDAFERMEYGDPSVPSGGASSGWAARYLAETAAGATGELRGIGVGSVLPLTLRDAPQTLPIKDFYFNFPGEASTSLLRQNALLDTYLRRRPAVSAPAIDTVATFGLAGIDFTSYAPENGAQYAGEFGLRMRDVAALIKADVGVEVVSIDVEGWDLHADLGPAHGAMAQLLHGLTTGLDAFYLDMLGHLDDYVLVVLSEFGRHAVENGSAGTDHGHGNAMFVLGGNVNGGQVIADWPGLAPDQLDNDDLAITIDYRDILGEILVERLGVTDLAPIFPGFSLTPRGIVS